MSGDFTLDRKKNPGGIIGRASMGGYKDMVTDEQLVALIEQGVQNSVGDFLNSSDLARETTEGHLRIRNDTSGTLGS